MALQLDNLLRFNGQFSPAWLPRYVILQAWADLPRVAVAAMAAEGYLPYASADPRARLGIGLRRRTGRRCHRAPRGAGRAGPAMTLTAGLLLALLSTAALSYGFYLQHTVSGTLPALTLRHPLSSLSALFTNWKWLAGFVTGLSGWALYIVALGLAPLALVQATSAGGVGLLALLVQRGGGRLTRPERLAVAASVGGLVLLGLSLPAGARQASAPGWAAPLGWVLASAVLAMIAAIPWPGAAQARRRARGGGGAALRGWRCRDQGSGRPHQPGVLVRRS